MLKQPPTFLVEALRDGLQGLGEAALASALAAGSIGGEASPVSAPAGFHPAQGDAYRACLGTGVRLVWGPPGTGKTTVLSRAICDLISRGDRVLLVSATNIAVDNALLGVVRQNRHASGDIVRVGPPQLKEIADDPTVSLPLIVRERLTETTGRSNRIERELVAIRDRAVELAALGARAVGFDPPAYFAALKLLRTPGFDVASANTRSDDAGSLLVAAIQTLVRAEEVLVKARRGVTAVESSRRQWDEVDELRLEQSQLLDAAGRRDAAVLLSTDRCHRLRTALEELENQRGIARWRAKDRREQLVQDLREAEEQASRDKDDAASARVTAQTRHSALEQQVRGLIARIPQTREQIGTRHAELRAAQAAHQSAEHQVRRLRREADEREQEARRARDAHALTTHAERRGWPSCHAEIERLQPQAATDARRRPELEKQFEQVQEEHERLVRNAQKEIIGSARLVATTLARFRTNKAVFEGPYDVVLVDEAGAATLPEVLLATAKAGRAAVLLGDFMQLGPVIPPALKDLKRPDVERWLLPDIFQHCAIRDPEDARRHPGCVSLVEQHRFGPTVMRLANELAYGGSLQHGRRAPAPRPADDPEIVLIDTDGLHELAHVHLTGRRKGWWAAGSLISRALVELHHEGGEETGVVTPYGVQAEATLEALRDVEVTGRPLAEVGTTHRFQGREFPIVIFDTVEGAGSRELWMARARMGTDEWEREGARLFNVAVTRVQTRLYIIGSEERITEAKRGTAFAYLAAMIGTAGVRRLQAKQLITPPSGVPAALGQFGSTLADVLSRHVEVTDVDDEHAFFTTFEDQIRGARASLWLWAPWVAKRIRGILPLLEDAARRGVRVTVFIRDNSDQVQRTEVSQDLIADLRAVVHTVVPINVMHQKVVVIDERTVMLGSLNALSQSWTREVMLTMSGAHFARKLLAHLNAEDFARPPPCGRCGGTSIEVRRRSNGIWFWRCYDTVCKTDHKGRSNAWNQNIRLASARSQ
nr:AAA domain-containing protein [Parafrankia elaeagni]